MTKSILTKYAGDDEPIDGRLTLRQLADGITEIVAHAFEGQTSLRLQRLATCESRIAALMVLIPETQRAELARRADKLLALEDRLRMLEAKLNSK